MMATQEEIDAARRNIERLRDEHVNDVIALARLVEDGALKGEAGDRLAADIRAWDRGFKDLFTRALSLLDSLPSSGPGKGAAPR
ncbi:hypothetical protein ACFPOI_47760 [Nonomuraea angiospora]|uniref:Uncharacterized protein n=1 Tax=Nonomuraea angiospora TaxID=46172 RepID=A0ABR9LXU9_9ACTN|nr:hypothetical protein [Nonomuraea angiospora]MBE1585471.1 hypothetical protein [Nonomuraea angiospora]MDX3103121.1 hypothetical protein [Nonomuraea angiospora]